MINVTAVALSPITEEPGVLRAGHSLCGKRSPLAALNVGRTDTELSDRPFCRREFGRLRSRVDHERQIGIAARVQLPVLHVVEFHTVDIAGNGRRRKRWLIESPDVTEPESA